MCWVRQKVVIKHWVKEIYQERMKPTVRGLGGVKKKKNAMDGFSHCLVLLY